MADKTGKPGGQRVYSDLAIETGLVVRMVYKLAYRQTEGFLHSIASLLGLGIEIPDYSTLCRRSRLLRKKLRIPKAASNQPIHLMIDSTGLRIHVGTARKPPKQRAWRKLHIAVDRETGNIVASELTASRCSRRNPSPRFANTDSSTSSVRGGGQCIRQGSGLRSDRSAQPWTKDARGDSAATKRDAQSEFEHPTSSQERDRHIRPRKTTAGREWYKLSGCSKAKHGGANDGLSLAKRSSGPKCGLERWRGTDVEHRIGCEILNNDDRAPGPDTYCAGDSATGTGRSAICSGKCNNEPSVPSDYGVLCQNSAVSRLQDGAAIETCAGACSTGRIQPLGDRQQLDRRSSQTAKAARMAQVAHRR